MSMRKPASGPDIGLLIRLAVLLLLIMPHWLIARDLFNGYAAAFAQITGNPDGLYWDLMTGNWLIGVAFLKVSFAIAHGLGVDYIIVIRVITTVMLLGLYHEFTQLGRRLFDLGDGESRWLALLCLASPTLYVLMGGTTVIPNPLCFWFLYAGHRLFWSQSVWHRWVGLLLMTVSFQVASNLVMSLALDLAFLYRFADQRRSRWPWTALQLAAALAVYTTMRLISPPAEFYASYNQLLNPLHRESLMRLVQAVLKYLTWGVLPLGAVLLAWLALPVARKAIRSAAPASTPRMDWVPAALAFFLAASAAFPYVMVGKGPALFHWVAIGDGVVEQLLRSVYAGPLAPRWGSPTMQHAILMSGPLAMLCWFASRSLWQKRQVWQGELSAGALALVLLPMFLAFIVPSYVSKLQTQVAEISMRKGLSQLPAPPPGIVDIRFTPMTDWIFWVGSANVVMREAWGDGRRFGMFHQTDRVRDELIWQYHTILLAQDGLRRPVVQHMLAMDGFPGSDCVSRYRAHIDDADWPGLLFGGWLPDLVAPARITWLGTQCEKGQVLANPFPDKPVIP